MCTLKKSASLPLHEGDGLLLLRAGLWVGFGAGGGVRIDYKRALFALAEMGDHPACSERRKVAEASQLCRQRLRCDHLSQQTKVVRCIGRVGLSTLSSIQRHFQQAGAHCRPNIERIVRWTLHDDGAELDQGLQELDEVLGEIEGDL